MGRGACPPPPSDPFRLLPTSAAARSGRAAAPPPADPSTISPAATHAITRACIGISHASYPTPRPTGRRFRDPDGHPLEDGARDFDESGAVRESKLVTTRRQAPGAWAHQPLPYSDAVPPPPPRAARSVPPLARTSAQVAVMVGGGGGGWGTGACPAPLPAGGPEADADDAAAAAAAGRSVPLPNSAIGYHADANIGPRTFDDVAYHTSAILPKYSRGWAPEASFLAGGVRRHAGAASAAAVAAAAAAAAATNGKAEGPVAPPTPLYGGDLTWEIAVAVKQRMTTAAGGVRAAWMKLVQDTPVAQPNLDTASSVECGGAAGSGMRPFHERMSIGHCRDHCDHDAARLATRRAVGGGEAQFQWRPSMRARAPNPALTAPRGDVRAALSVAELCAALSARCGVRLEEDSVAAVAGAMRAGATWEDVERGGASAAVEWVPGDSRSGGGVRGGAGSGDGDYYCTDNGSGRNAKATDPRGSRLVIDNVLFMRMFDLEEGGEGFAVGTAPRPVTCVVTTDAHRATAPLGAAAPTQLGRAVSRGAVAQHGSAADVRSSQPPTTTWGRDSTSEGGVGTAIGRGSGRARAASAAAGSGRGTNHGYNPITGGTAGVSINPITGMPAAHGGGVRRTR